MAPENPLKPKRRKKNKSRTLVSSESDSESEPRRKAVLTTEVKNESTAPKKTTDAEISSAFTKFYMQRAAQEFEDDLDKIRGAKDFRDDALPILINALQQGTSMFSMEEQRRIVEAGVEKHERVKGD